MRWFGPGDLVPLPYIRQAGASVVFTSLHEIPYGDTWPREAIRIRKELLESAGLEWRVVESVPVHEDIKTGRGNLKQLFANYADTLRNLAAEGIRNVIYNFMPVLDWVRTDMRWPLPDGSFSMRFDPVRFAAFDVHALKRNGAEADYTSTQLDAARTWWQGLKTNERDSFVQSVIDVFPGVKWGLSLDAIRTMLSRYDGIGDAQLRSNFARFLEAIVPTAESLGVRLAIHPDDPPFSVLGLPRIVSTADDIASILDMVDSPANGLCFCTGSFGARADNDLPDMIRRFADRVHALHLRNTRLCEDGSFHEAGHLSGTADMRAILHHFLQARTSADPVPFRPDHGLLMMDDLAKPEGITPGYPLIGRMKGLAELRGLIAGLIASETNFASSP